LGPRPGQYAATCSLTGASPYDSLPNSGYAKYDLSTNSNDTDDSLASDGATCSTGRNGETCNSGFCGSAGVCISAVPTNFTSSNSNATVFAGPADGDQSGGSTNGTGNDARFQDPEGVCFTPDGLTFFVPDSNNHIVRQITVATANVTTLAGTAGSSGTTDDTGSDARFTQPEGCVVDPTGTDLYVADTQNYTIRKIVIATGVVTTLAGSAGTSGAVDDTGTAALFDFPRDLAIDSTATNLYISDHGNRAIRKMVINTQVVSTFAGSLDNSGYVDGIGTAARFFNPFGLAIDSTDTYLYVGDSATSHRVRRITIATQEVTTVAGTGTAGGTDGVGTAASFNQPFGIVIDPTDTHLYVTEFAGHRIRRIEIATGTVTTLAGSGSAGDVSGIGTAGSFNVPQYIDINPTGTILYFTEGANSKIRRLQIP